MGMKIGLFGFGKAGRAVASVLLQDKKTNLCWVVRKSKTQQHKSISDLLNIESSATGLILGKDEWPATRLLKKYPVDAIIDFSCADSIIHYGQEAAEKNIAIISAISNYPQSTLHLIHKLSHKTRILWSPNITIGINFLLLAAKILKKIAPHTDIEIIEEHFKKKTGVSGTAIKIANSLGVEKHSIKTIRAGGIIGRHEILFGFPYQTIRLSHESIAREAFGNGALFAARNIVSLDNGLYSMESLLAPYFDKPNSDDLAKRH
jgi:4-hydroxy-tetrahydrodipicolinate reductase